MPNITYYVVLPFIWDAEGNLIAEEAAEAPSGSVAMRRAAALISTKAGAVAFSRTGDPQLGDFAAAIILGRYGETPDDLDFFG